jgi:hypothetical protein
MSKKKPDEIATIEKPVYSRSKFKTDKTTTIEEPVYTRNELIAAASSFGVKPEVVAGALKLAGKDMMTKTEAEKAVKDFLERKV